jgi:hypothetical protein
MINKKLNEVRFGELNWNLYLALQYR